MFKVGDVISNCFSKVSYEILDINSKYYMTRRLKDNKILEFHKKTVEHSENKLNIKHILKQL